jgi:transposase-like protein
MGAKVSAEMKHALFLVVQEGKPVKESARLAGVDASSLYKALRRLGPWEHRKTLTGPRAAAGSGVILSDQAGTARH